MNKLFFLTMALIFTKQINAYNFEFYNHLSSTCDVKYSYYNGSLTEQEGQLTLLPEERKTISTPLLYCLNKVWVKASGASEWILAGDGICFSGTVRIFWGTTKNTGFYGGPVAVREY
jgi:hypothetical protein